MQTRTIQLIYVLLLLFLSSRATGPRPNTANYEKILNLWVGEQIEQLTTAWGYPEKQFIAPNGRKVYVYKQSRIVSRPSYYIPGTSDVTFNDLTNTATITTSPGVTIGGGVDEYFCVTWIEINNEGTIVNWSWRGNDCKAGELK
jgi:hypothetical protein